MGSNTSVLVEVIRQQGAVELLRANLYRNRPQLGRRSGVLSRFTHCGLCLGSGPKQLGGCAHHRLIVIAREQLAMAELKPKGHGNHEDIEA